MKYSSSWAATSICRLLCGICRFCFLSPTVLLKLDIIARVSRCRGICSGAVECFVHGIVWYGPERKCAKESIIYTIRVVERTIRTFYSKCQFLELAYRVKCFYGNRRKTITRFCESIADDTKQDIHCALKSDEELSRLESTVQY